MIRHGTNEKFTAFTMNVVTAGHGQAHAPHGACVRWMHSNNRYVNSGARTKDLSTFLESSFNFTSKYVIENLIT